MFAFIYESKEPITCNILVIIWWDRLDRDPKNLHTSLITPLKDDTSFMMTIWGRTFLRKIENKLAYVLNGAHDCWSRILTKTLIFHMKKISLKNCGVSKFSRFNRSKNVFSDGKGGLNFPWMNCDLKKSHFTAGNMCMQKPTVYSLMTLMARITYLGGTKMS